MAPSFHIATLFPDMCRRVVEESIIGRAVKAGLLNVQVYNIREYAFNRWNRVDDTTYGGGMGMLMQAEPIYLCWQDIAAGLAQNPHVIFMSPQGKTLTQQRAVELSQLDRDIIILCGHYEGVDQRVLDEIVDEEISIGDYVLTGGELGALVLVDCVGRLCPGVLSNEECFTEESHYNGLLEYPQYTKPAVWHDRTVPEVLVSGHHANIAKWRRQQSIRTTLVKRPELLETAPLDKKDLAYLAQLREQEQPLEPEKT
ncbi:MAG: tRNA (guanosine(37)-N1)-methyltransferase TrmD [Angelakisella sp.]